MKGNQKGNQGVTSGTPGKDAGVRFIETLEAVVRAAVTVATGRGAAVRLLKAIERGGWRPPVGSDATAKELCAALNKIINPPLASKRPGPAPVRALLTGKRLSDADKATLKDIDEAWTARIKLASPPGGGDLMLVDGGSFSDMTVLNRAWDGSILDEVFAPWLEAIQTTALFTRQRVPRETLEKTVHDFMHNLVVNGIGMRTMERMMGCRHGALMDELKWALNSWRARSNPAAVKAEAQGLGKK